MLEKLNKFYIYMLVSKLDRFVIYLQVVCAIAAATLQLRLQGEPNQKWKFLIFESFIK